ncbi:MAG: radical SAM protein, partial [Candidatus Aminicenantales bacterium]
MNREKRTAAAGPVRFYSGWRAVPLRLRLLLSYGAARLRRKKNPLFILGAKRGGLLSTLRTVKGLRFDRIVRQGGTYRYCLTVPALPSKPYDMMISRGGLNINAAGTPYKSTIDYVILAVSRKCPYRCAHCYERFNLRGGADVPLETWKRTVAEVQDVGAAIIVLSGGEPMSRFDGVLEILGAADKGRSEFHIHTSGHGVTPRRARLLKDAGLSAAAVGLDDVRPGREDALRGYKGAFAEAVASLRAFQDAGLFTYLNLCLSKDLVRSGDLPAYMDMARDLGVGAVRFLEPRPTGGYCGETAGELFSVEDRAAATVLFTRMNTGRRYRRHPFISYEAFYEAPERLGCRMGGHSLLYIDSAGNVNPCVFLPVRFGNIREEGFPAIYARMRASIPRPVRACCPSLTLADVFKKQKETGQALPIPIDSIR